MQNIMFKILVTVFVLVISATKSPAQDNTVALKAADTSAFSVNKKGGWQLFNSYAATNKDSVQLEIILQHQNNINWAEEQYVGLIKIAKAIPQATQVAAFNLLSTFYLVRIDKEGKCYLRLLSGTKPENDPAVIPARIVFKK